MTAGLILAADEAAAFATPKPLAELDGRPLLAHAVEAMLAVEGLLQVTVALGADAEVVAPAIETWGVEVVVVPGWRAGEGAILREALAAVDGFERVVVGLGDQPRVTGDAFGAVLAASGGGVGAARAVYAGVIGYPVALGPEALARREALADGDTIEVLLEGIEVRTVEAAHLGHPDRVLRPRDLTELARRPLPR